MECGGGTVIFDSGTMDPLGCSHTRALPPVLTTFQTCPAAPARLAELPVPDGTSETITLFPSPARIVGAFLQMGGIG